MHYFDITTSGFWIAMRASVDDKLLIFAYHIDVVLIVFNGQNDVIENETIG